MKTASWSIGSVWRRCDPHVHTPATALNNNFSQDWPGFFDAIANASQPVEILGITDYVTIRGYREFRQRLPKGKLPRLRLVFPNIEFRIALNTRKQKGINLHVLISPYDADHERHIEEALTRLVMTLGAQRFSATEGGLCDLGRFHDKTLVDDEAAFRVGVNQFKPSFETLRDWWRQEGWLKANSLVAVSAKSNDGTAGLADDDGFAALRKDIQRFAHILFSATPSDRAYWLGDGTASIEELRADYGGCKPCLHGCDAHSIGKVLAPDLNRLCWIRAEPTFEGLRQVVLEPRERVHLGERPPGRPSANAITRLEVIGVGGADAAFDLNPGMVAIIGEKGSGKTALADLVAKAAGAAPSGGASFIIKAREHLDGCESWVDWADGTPRTGGSVLGGEAFFDAGQPAPKVRYLSQHFVEQLCAGDDPVHLSDQLVHEIDSVVFDYLDQSDRLSASSFSELRDMRCGSFRERRDELTVHISEQCAVIESEREAQRSLPKRKARMAEVGAEIDRFKAEQRQLTQEGQSASKQREYEELVASLTNTDDRLRVLKEKRQAIVRIRAKLSSLEVGILGFDSAIRAELLNAGLAAQESIDQVMGLLVPVLPQGADTFLASQDSPLAAEITQLESSAIPAQAGLQPRKALLAKIEEIKKALVGDATKLKRATELQQLIARREAEQLRLTGEVARIETTYKETIALAQDRRRRAYAEVFDQFAKEQEILEGLYSPLTKHLGGSGEAEQRLAFNVKRVVNLRNWAERGEQLLDLRGGPLRGAGALLEIAEKELAQAWRTGTGKEAKGAIEKVLQSLIAEEIQKQFKQTTTPRMFADWFFSTGHIQLRYGLKYDGTDLHLLSPGTRGIVLLILYLAIDRSDDRPLVIDQPEENLDPRSVYQVLRHYFRDARQRRQVLLVTHNANLVVNTDADQVIVASSARQSAGGLPSFSYTAGALEDPETRRHVCELLEGGEQAFREREQRYFGGRER